MVPIFFRVTYIDSDIYMVETRPQLMANENIKRLETRLDEFNEQVDTISKSLELFIKSMTMYHLKAYSIMNTSTENLAIIIISMKITNIPTLGHPRWTCINLMALISLYG